MFYIISPFWIGRRTRGTFTMDVVIVVRERQGASLFSTYEAVGVFGAGAAPGALPMAAVTDVGSETAAVALLGAHSLRHCRKTGARYLTVPRKHLARVTVETKNVPERERH